MQPLSPILLHTATSSPFNPTPNQANLLNSTAGLFNWAKLGANQSLCRSTLAFILGTSLHPALNTMEAANVLSQLHFHTVLI